MLKHLHLRAAALKATKFEIAQEAERRLTDEKNRNYEKVTRPNGFFCTFRYETGQHAAIKLGVQEKLMFRDDPLRAVKRACEPDDLLWENLEVTQKARSWR